MEDATSAQSDPEHLTVLDYLERSIAGTLLPHHRTHLRYPTAIAHTLGFRLIRIGEGIATLHVDVTTDRFGNQQGTIHGGFLTDLADATIGTACSTLTQPGETFTSINLTATFLRPMWDGELIAEAYPTHTGKTLSHWYCMIERASDRKPVMTATSTTLTLRGTDATGR